MNSGQDEDDEDRWLQARERDEPGPPIPDATAATYAELVSLLEDLPVVPTGATLRTGWQQSVLDAISRGEPASAAASSQVRPIDRAKRQRFNKRRAAIAVSCLAVAAGIIIIAKVLPPGATAGPELAINALTAGEPAHLGQDELIAGARAVVRGAINGPGELRVYGPDDLELARCPAPDPHCVVERVGERTKLSVEVTLPAPGALHVVLLSAPMPGPSRGRVLDLTTADRTGIHFKSIDTMVR